MEYDENEGGSPQWDWHGVGLNREVELKNVVTLFIETALV